jgi:hypothetical protein
LQWVGFYDNQIRNVGHDLLKDLEFCDYVVIREPCLDRKAFSREEVQMLNLQLPLSCPPLATEAPPTTTTISTTTTEPIAECSSGCFDQMMEISKKQEEKNYEKC